MANRLRVATVHSILTLRDRGWSHRRIARELGVHRETVARYLRLVAEGFQATTPDSDIEKSKPAKPAHGSDDVQPVPGLANDGDAKPANPPTGSGPLSRCEPFREIIIAALEQGLSYQRIWQDLRHERGFAGGYDSVKRFARRLKRTHVLPFRRMESAPGEQAQVDFGKGAPILTPEGKRRRPHAFRMVLSFSRKAYSEVVYRQTTEAFIRCLENAFWHFGGVPRTLVVDNLKAAVLQPDWYDPELNPKIEAFAAHYGTVILPTKPRTPRHKGKIERQVGYLQDNGLKGKSFGSLTEQNAYLLDWERRVADTRIHGTIKKQVGPLFQEVERSALLPLPPMRFPSFQEAQRIVSRDAHVEVDKAYYSVPPEYLGKTTWVRWDGHLVRVFDERMKPIAVHVRDEPGRFRTQPEHIAPQKVSGVEFGAARLLRDVRAIGPHTLRWAESMLGVRGIQGVRVLMGLLNLSRRHASMGIEEACRIAHTHGAYRLRTLRQLIRRTAPPQERFEFLEEHPVIRNLKEYAVLVEDAFQNAWEHDRLEQAAREQRRQDRLRENHGPKVLPQTPSPSFIPLRWKGRQDERRLTNVTQEVASVGNDPIPGGPTPGGGGAWTHPCRVLGVGGPG